jgi:OmpA-OmpF porin, OOP family
MRRSIVPLLAFALLVLPSCLEICSALAQTRDVAGSRDYPGIGRFAGSVITGYQVKDFDASRLQAAPFRDGKAADERRPEGRVTRIAYRTNLGPSIVEVGRNFETQLAKAGFETLLACDTDACGGIPFVEAVDALPIPQMWIDGFNYRYHVSRKAEGGRETYAAVLVSKNNDDIYAQLVVAVVGAIENKMVDAGAMAKGLREQGHIALYGIYFDTDKAVIKPESRPTLDEIAKLLRAQPQLTCSSSATPTTRARSTTMSACRAGGPKQSQPSSPSPTRSPRHACAPRASASWRRSAPTPPTTAARSTGASSSSRRRRRGRTASMQTACSSGRSEPRCGAKRSTW